MKYLLISILILLVVLLPIALHPATRIADDSDGLVVAWIIHTFQDNVLEGKPLFDGGVFYPHKDSLLFSDSFISSALLTFPLRLFSPEPLIPYSAATLGSFFLTLMAAFLFEAEVLKLTGRRNDLLAFTIASVFTLSAIHMRYVGHLHMFALQFVVGSMYGILKFIETKNIKWIYLAVVLALLQVWQSIFLVYYIIFFCLFLLLLPKVRNIFWQQKIGIGAALIAFIVGSLPLAVAYLHFYAAYHVVRDIREVIHFSLLFSDLTGQFWSPVAYLFLLAGLPVFLLSQARKNILAISLSLLGIFAFIMSLGPALHLGAETVKFQVLGHVLHVPLPYTLFYYLAPAFKAFRTPSRFLPLAMLSLLSVTAISFSRAKAISAFIMPISILAIGILCLLVVPLNTFQIPSVSEFPAYVHFIAKSPPAVIIKLPIRDWADPRAKEDVYQMWYSTLHKQRLVNGQSGFFPDEWLAFQHQVTVSFPSREAVQLMGQRGVTEIVIQKQDYPKLSVLELISLGLTPVYEDGQVLIASLSK